MSMYKNDNCEPDYKEMYEWLKDQILREQEWSLKDYDSLEGGTDRLRGMLFAYGSLVSTIMHIEEECAGEDREELEKKYSLRGFIGY